MNHMNRVLSPEIRFAALLSRPHLNSEQVALAAALTADVDFGKLHKLIIQHRIWPCVYCNVRDYLPGLLADSSFNYLKKLYYANVAQSQRSFALCGKLLRKFKENGVSLKILKGAPLAFKLYGDVSKRYSHDIDLVIRDTDITVANAILAREGFQAKGFEGLLPEQESLYWDGHKDIVYLDKFGTMIELHVRLSVDKLKITDQYFDALFNTNTPNNIAHLELIYLCWHGSQTLFHRLKWLVDIALYLELQPQTFREELVRVARDLRAFRMLSASWVLAHQVFDTDLPQEIFIFYEQDAACRILVTQCLIQFDNPKLPNSFASLMTTHFVGALLYQSKKELFSILLRHFKPNDNDRNVFPKLPHRLHFIYYLLRPFLVIYRRFHI